MSKFEVDIDVLVKNGLSLTSFFILYNLHNKSAKYLVKYIDKFGEEEFDGIGVDRFNDLVDRGYITIDTDDRDNIKFSDISLTEKGKGLFKDDIDKLFEEFRKCYPKSVKQGQAIRRLHQDLARCKRLYAEALKEVPHEKLCKCARMYHLEKVKSNNEWYTQLLATWLSEKNYQQYLEEVDKPEKEERGFTRDI